ncbi:RDD family protein [Gordonia neofelifaecis]|uniref:Membrane protein n=1 Tax=Gordonia neofelifaecis NRRL B-59395 TaxID=644548 RepID=F1YKL5_9ACTN|nr:RDD family protein [Gordonia neofelifaecis]EGD54659.1 membrane protein [Gordonia neofelifaecis NRRL B-59395]
MTERQPAAPRAAGIVTRAIAAVIDTVLVFLVLGLGYLGTAFVLFTMDVTNFAFPQVSWWFTTTGFIAIAVVYLVACWSMTGRTVGNVLMGLRVVRVSGEPMHFVQIVLRSVTYVFFPVGLFWVVFSPRRMSLQDAVLRTKVVYTEG